jgi:hypothetical protein
VRRDVVAKHFVRNGVDHPLAEIANGPPARELAVLGAELGEKPALERGDVAAPEALERVDDAVDGSRVASTGLLLPASIGGNPSHDGGG